MMHRPILNDDATVAEKMATHARRRLWVDVPNRRAFARQMARAAFREARA